MSARRISRRVGMSASDFTQCRNLHVKIRYPIIIYHIPVTYICAFDSSAQISDYPNENFDTEAHPPRNTYSVKKINPTC